MSLADKLDAGLSQTGLELSPAIKQKLLDYLQLLQKWNKVHNLTAVRDQEEMVTLHLLDSLSVVPYVDAGQLLDVGSGGGLPGIPLALSLPQLQVTVLDASQKKTSFLRQVKAELGIANLQVVCSRVEDYHPAQPFDCVISRAFSDLKQFTALTRHLLAEDGYWLAMKGVFPAEELAQLALQPSNIQPLHVPGLDAERHLVRIDFENVGVI